MNELANFDSLDELKKMTVQRLFVLQKRCIKLLDHYIFHKELYDDNDIMNTLNDIYTINTIISLKISENKKCIKNQM